MAIGLCAFSFLNSLLIPIHHGTVYVVIAGHSRTDHPVGFPAIAGFQTDLFYMRERIKSIRKNSKNANPFCLCKKAVCPTLFPRFSCSGLQKSALPSIWTGVADSDKRATKPRAAAGYAAATSPSCGGTAHWCEEIPSTFRFPCRLPSETDAAPRCRFPVHRHGRKPAPVPRHRQNPFAETGTPPHRLRQCPPHIGGESSSECFPA